MAKKKNKRQKLKRNKDSDSSFPIGALTWFETDGLHTIMPGEPPSEEMLEAMTKEYQRQIRNSPLWDEMVKQFGKEEAENLLKQCRAELRT